MSERIYKNKMNGYIPEKLKIVFVNKEVMFWRWENFDKSYSTTVMPAFVVDHEKPKNLETAMSWANGKCFEWDRETRESIRVATPSVVTVDNNPISIKIVGFVKRSQGGRAYKVIFDDNRYYVDLREDVLFDTIINSNIMNGVPESKFIWCVVGSQMKLVRVDSDLHNELKKANKVSRSKCIPKSKLEVGGIYRNKKNEKFIYLGERWSFEDSETEYSQYVRAEHHSYYRSVINPNDLNLNDVTLKSSKKMIFYKLYARKEDKLEINYDYDGFYWRIEHCKTKALYEKIGHVEFDFDKIVDNSIKTYITRNNHEKPLYRAFRALQSSYFTKDKPEKIDRKEFEAFKDLEINYA